ncbi:SCO7613 C-terminal domain-containing membrane protein [Kribbella sp. NPDC049174]|uniref:SCO7613 C-terminal domain-containing membrane protein n=1 Tax=Kribbella sp. NPDC049174 TaxID=3364112 RepID=UPI003715CF10
MNAHVTAPLQCPVCHTLLHLSVEAAPQPVQPPPLPFPPPAPAYPPPPPRGIPASTPLYPPASVPAPPSVPAEPRPVRRPAASFQPLPPPPQPVRRPEPPRRRLSPQATLLSLGVLLLLAAGVTFLAVNWDNLPVAAQAGIIGLLAALAFAGSIPASRSSLAASAEALAILGCGLLTVDLYGARALGLISKDAVDGVTYSAIVFGTVALINLLMTRLAPTVVTYGVTTVIAGQLPLPLVLVDRVSLPWLLAALLVQVVVTLVLSELGTAIVRRTGAVTSAVVFCGILVTGMLRTFEGLLTKYSFDYRNFTLTTFTDADLRTVIATTAVVCVAAVTGILILRKRPLPASITQGLGEGVCAAAAGFVVATCLPQLPGPGRWLTTGLATVLAIAVILRGRRTGMVSVILHTAVITVASVNLLFCLWTGDVRQLGFIAGIVAVLAVFAALRKVVDAEPAAGLASLSAQFAVVLFTMDDFIGLWAGAVSLAVIGACGVGLAGRYVGRPLERVLMYSAASAVVVAEIVASMVSADAGTGVVLTIAAAPLIAYGMNPARRYALLVAGLLLIIANTAFVLAAGGTTIEWFTVPPAIVMVAIGILAWRDQPSWVYLGPGLLIGLVPSALIADGNDNWIRVTCVVAAALVVIVIGAQLGLQAPFVIGAAVLAKIGIWQFIEVAPLIPRWITLGTAGAVLLAVGATYERRLSQAKQAARWLSALR